MTCGLGAAASPFSRFPTRGLADGDAERWRDVDSRFWHQPSTVASIGRTGADRFGGIAMILGAAVRMVGVLMALNLAGAWVLVHTSGLLAVDHDGPELVIAPGLLSLVLAVTGSGRVGSSSAA